MLSNEAVLSIPFRLAISVVVLSLAMPICLNCMDTGEIELSRKAAFEICMRIKDGIELVATGGIGGSRVIELADKGALLRSGTEITVGDFPAGPNSSMIRCSDSGGWSRAIQINIDSGIAGVCSPILSPIKIDRHSRLILISHEIVDGLDLILVGVQ